MMTLLPSLKAISTEEEEEKRKKEASQKIMTNMIVRLQKTR